MKKIAIIYALVLGSFIAFAQQNITAPSATATVKNPNVERMKTVKATIQAEKARPVITVAAKDRQQIEQIKAANRASQQGKLAPETVASPRPTTTTK